jgi:predicted MFS family arabinose efflux permease
MVSGAAGLGAAAGPLIGGLITSAVSWRASFVLQVLIVALVALLARKLHDPPRETAAPHFDLVGAILSAAGLFFVVFGILQSSTYGWFSSRADFSVGGTVLIPQGGISPVWLYIVIGALFLLWFFLHLRSTERHGKDPLVSTRLFHNRTSNLGLTTQTIQWLTMQGSFFVISVFLQQVRGYSAIQTGLMLTPTTVGVLLAAGTAERLARRRPQRFLIRRGFAVTIIGLLLVLALAREHSSNWTFMPGLFLVGAGIGVMLTSSGNVVQSAFPEEDQGDISGVSRSVSNLGSSLGVALAGSVLAADAFPGNRSFAVSLVIMTVIAVIGFVAALLIPKDPEKAAA